MAHLARLELHRLFLVLWNMIILVHESDLWHRPVVLFLGILGIALAIFIPNMKWSIYLSLIPATGFLIYWYPFNANHLNYYILISLSFMILCYLKTDFGMEHISRFLFRSMGLVYLIAGLHKLNSDFLNPAVSCNTEVLGRFLERLYLPIPIDHWIFPWSTVALELTLGAGLIWGRFLKPLMLVSLLFHLALTWSNFVNFASIPLIVFLVYGLTFLDDQHKEKRLSFRKVTAYYVFGQLLLTIFGSFDIMVGQLKLSYILNAVIWTVIASLVFYLIIKSRMVPFLNRQSRLKTICLSLIALMGFQPYLGLSTVNSFSMFSNLQTEGAQWNHLILPDWLKIFSYQEQIYFVEKVTPEYTGTVRDFPREGLGMPKLEVYRLYEIWKKTAPLPAEFILRKEGDGQGKNAVELLPPEDDPYSWWEKKLFYFRAVQYTGPNQCRW